MHFAFALLASVTQASETDLRRLSEFTYIYFHTPECAECQRRLQELAEGLTENIAVVDCAAQPEVCIRFKVAGYPAVRVFASGFKVYSGDISVQALQQFKAQLTADVIQEMSLEATAELARQRNASVFFYLKAPKKDSHEELLQRFVGTGLVFGFQRSEITELVVYKGKKQKLFDGIMFGSSLSNFALRESQPPFQRFRDLQFMELAKASATVVLLVLDPTGANKAEAEIKQAEEFALTQRKYPMLQLGWAQSAQAAAFLEKQTHFRLDKGPVLLALKQSRKMLNVRAQRLGENVPKQIFHLIKELDRVENQTAQVVKIVIPATAVSIAIAVTALICLRHDDNPTQTKHAKEE